MTPLARPLAFCLLSSFAAAQYQPNSMHLSLWMDGDGGSHLHYPSAVRSPCQPVVIRSVVAARLRDLPMVLLVSPSTPTSATTGATQTPAGQWFNLDPGNTIALPAMTANSFEALLDLRAPGTLSLQLLTLDPLAADGYRLSAPGHYRSAASTVVATRPRVLGGKAGGLVQVATDGATSALGNGRETPVGLAFDGRGTTYYGRERSHSPLVVEIIERDPRGNERSLGPVFDTAGFAYELSANGFDLAWTGDRLVFTHPRLLSSGSGGTGIPGSIRSLDPRTGAIETLIDGLANPSGLALAADGTLYYGVVEGHPLRYDIYRRTPDGSIARVTRAFDASRAHVAVGVWAFDIALDGDRIAFNVPSYIEPSGRVRAGGIERLDLRTGNRTTLVPNLDYPTGLSFDDQGGLYYANAAFGPARARLHYRGANAASSSDLGLLFDKTGGSLPVGLWGIDVRVPCRSR